MRAGSKRAPMFRLRDRNDGLCEDPLSGERRPDAYSSTRFSDPMHFKSDFSIGRRMWPHLVTSPRVRVVPTKSLQSFQQFSGYAFRLSPLLDRHVGRLLLQ